MGDFQTALGNSMTQMKEEIRREVSSQLENQQGGGGTSNGPKR